MSKQVNQRAAINKANNLLISNNPINLENYKDNDNHTEMLIAMLILSQRATNSKLESIKSNVKFFFWLGMIGFGLALISILGLAGL